MEIAIDIAAGNGSCIKFDLGAGAIGRPAVKFPPSMSLPVGQPGRPRAVGIDLDRECIAVRTRCEGVIQLGLRAGPIRRAAENFDDFIRIRIGAPHHARSVRADLEVCHVAAGAGGKGVIQLHLGTRTVCGATVDFDYPVRVGVGQPNDPRSVYRQLEFENIPGYPSGERVVDLHLRSGLVRRSAEKFVQAIHIRVGDPHRPGFVPGKLKIEHVAAAARDEILVQLDHRRGLHSEDHVIAKLERSRAELFRAASNNNRGINRGTSAATLNC